MTERLRALLGPETGPGKAATTTDDPVARPTPGDESASRPTATASTAAEGSDIPDPSSTDGLDVVGVTGAETGSDALRATKRAAPTRGQVRQRKVPAKGIQSASTPTLESSSVEAAESAAGLEEAVSDIATLEARPAGAADEVANTAAAAGDIAAPMTPTTAATEVPEEAAAALEVEPDVAAALTAVAQTASTDERAVDDTTSTAAAADMSGAEPMADVAPEAASGTADVAAVTAEPEGVPGRPPELGTDGNGPGPGVLTPPTLDPTSPRGNIRDVIAAIRSVSEPDPDLVATSPSPLQAPAVKAVPVVHSSPALSSTAVRSVTSTLSTPTAAVAPAPAAPPVPRTAVVYAAQNAIAPDPWYVSLRVELRLASIAAAIVLVSLLVGLAVSLLLPPVYAARTDVVIPVDSDRASGFLREDRRMLTHVEALQSRGTLLPAANEEGLDIKDLEEQLHIEIVNGSEVIRIEVWDRDAQRALRLTTRIAALYRSSLGADSGLTRAQEVLRRELQTLRERVAVINTRLADLAPTITNTADLAAAERARREAGQLEAESVSTFDRIGTVASRLDDLAVSNARLAPTTTVADPFILPDQVRPRPLWDTALAGSVGVVIAGAVVAFLWWRRTSEAS